MKSGSKAPPKRRGRPSKKAKTATQQKEQLCGDESTSVVAQPKQKAFRGLRGKLAGLIDMPVDVLHEIFMHLLPYDIFKLSRLNKQFRKLLMSKESRSIWRCAIENLDDFPPVPPDWNEPRWINLCYDPHCHFCLKNTCRTIEWIMRTRICVKCAKDLMEERYVRNSVYLLSGDVSYPLESLVLYRWGRQGKRSYLKADLDKVKEEHTASPDRVSFIRERRKLIQEVKDHADICEKWSNSQDNNRSDELQNLKNERRDAIVKELEALGYREELAGIRKPDSFENHELVKKPQRLTPRIWANIKDPLIEWLDEMRTKRLAREYQQLKKDRKLVAAEVLRKFKNERLPVIEALPEIMDFCEFPPIAAVLELPADVTVDESSFTTEVMSDVPRLIQEWRERKTDSVVDLLYLAERAGRRLSDIWQLIPLFGIDSIYENRYTGGNFPLDKAVIGNKLLLATTVFGCKACNQAQSPWTYPELGMFSLSKPLFYPQVLNHQCTTRSVVDWVCSYDRLNEPAEKLTHHNKQRRSGWSSRTIVYQNEMARIITALVSSTGLDPATTTTEEMDDLDRWFACHSCLRLMDSTIAQATKAFRWRAAVQHLLSKHRGCRENEWACMTSDEVQEGNKAYQDAGQGLSPFLQELDDTNWMCTHCRDLTTEKGPFGLEDVRAHVKKDHSIDDPQLNVDYFRTFEAGPEPPFVMNIAVTSRLRNDGNLPGSESDKPAPSVTDDWVDDDGFNW